MREFSVPLNFTVPDDGSAVDAVYAHAEKNPTLALFKRRTGGTWVDVTAREIAETVTAVAKGLIASGVGPGDRVALMSGTRYEWPILDFAIWSAGGVTVPVYETSSAEQVRWILQDSAAVALIVENAAHTDTVAGVVGDFPGLTTVLQIEPGDDEPGAIATLVERGADVADDDVRARTAALKASDPATLIYTSGTTGRPKGCMLTHSNLIAESNAIATSGFGALLQPGRRNLMFLPLAHVLARAVSLAAFNAGTTVGHTSDTKNIVAIFGEFKPDFILSVPRVFEKVYNTARQKAHSEGKGKIFDAAAEVAVEWSQAQDTGGAGFFLNLKHTVFDKLVYGKLKAALGGQCQLAISGGAPLGARLGHFFRGLGVTIYEGYGLTETTAAITVNSPGNQKVGTVGKPLAGNSVRIAEDGEILLKGPVVFTEYWKNEAATKDAIEDGWFHTGDLGSLDTEGYLSITGRKKEIIVTAGGKNVAPAGLEDHLRAHPLISQALVVGDQKPFIGALITIDPEAWPGWLERNEKASDATIESLIADVDLIAEIDEAIAEANKLVSAAESIKKYRILPLDFTEETGELTPTLKLKRNIILQNHGAAIEAIYSR
ncbi:Long-chain-fatty-acid--CoA ligase FadD15 [Rhodococcus sp. RD6.2]|uniref:AMP-dependent synthetase/ligase n=1 Tax=Rhodococcus sp. RD6.2 TaxID=260936 RepID=UPI00063B6D23|nr:long-chain fatty acid--CoA ligase [Rhodococcus sp. RD6.2]CRK51848.1 Long-chain-fatty-acid--CoA ligase FadD15 [Rhodococcus sp. RD6.2]